MGAGNWQIVSRTSLLRKRNQLRYTVPAMERTEEETPPSLASNPSHNSFAVQQAEPGNPKAPILGPPEDTG